VHEAVDAAEIYSTVRAKIDEFFQDGGM